MTTVATIAPLQSLKISWARVVKEFEIRFDEVFLNTQTKAHLDVCLQIIDGAKGKWCKVTLLDTIIAILWQKEVDARQQRRRQFNQYAVLRECIAIAASEAWITHIVKNGWEAVGEMPLSTELYDIPSDWADIPSLRTYMLGKQAYKQKTKQESCVDMLLRDPQCAEHGPCTMIRKVVHQIYMQHFNPLSLVAERMENTSIGMKDFCVDTWKCSTALTDFIKRESTSRAMNPVHFFTSYHDDIVNTANENKRRKLEGEGLAIDENTEDK